MKNREITYYSLLSRSNLRHIEEVADSTPSDTFITLGFEKKWFPHLWINANNKAFIEKISYYSDLHKLDSCLCGQIKEYARNNGEGLEQDKGDFQTVYQARKDWLKHTIFTFKDEYNKTQTEIFIEVVKWCEDWKNEWLETFNPYSPKELQEMHKDLKVPLWQELNSLSSEDDTSYHLIDFDNDKIQNTNDYKSHESAIRKRGFRSVNELKVFTPELTFILVTEELKGKSIANGKNKTTEIKTIDGFDYLNSYVKGYNEGVQFFEENFATSPSTLYGKHGTAYIKNLHQNYFHTQHYRLWEGWHFVKKKFPFIINHQIIKEYGYYSGIVSKVDDLTNNNLVLFKDFYKCSPIKENINTPIPQPKETKSDQLKTNLAKYGFFELEKVKDLKEEKQTELVELISSNQLPYIIAMFDFLNFISSIEEKYFSSKKAMQKAISSWFGRDKDGRGVRGNINSLSQNSKERLKTRFGAYEYKEKVQKDYELLK